MNWKRFSASLLAAGILLSGMSLGKRGPKPIVIEAQTLPYNLTVAWDASTDLSASYNCYLDGVVVTSVGVGVLTCQFPVSTLGSHTVAVTAVDPTFVPSESAPASLTFVLGAPGSPKTIKVK